MLRFLPVTLVLLVLIGGCAAGSRGEVSQLGSDSRTLPGADPGLVLPSIPSGREPLGLTETAREGSDTFSRSASATPSDTQLLLSASGDEISWGIYELPAIDELRYLDVQLGIPAGQQAFTALANYQTQRWDLQGPVVSGRVVTLDPLIHSSPGGQLYAAVLVVGDNSISVQALSLIAFHANTAPTAVLEADFESGNAPLIVQFDASASTDPDPGDSITLYHWDFNGDGVFDGSGVTPTISHTFEDSGSFDTVLVVEDRDGERSSAGATIGVNGLPLASLLLSQSVVNRGDTLTLNAGASSDPEAGALSFEFDTDGDGSFESNNGANPLLQVSMPVAGAFFLKVRVTDANAASATASAAILVQGFNAISIAPTAITLASSTSLAIVGGHPAIAYGDLDSSQAFYTRALDADGNEWGSPVAITGVGAADVSLAVINGQPAVAMFGGFTEHLHYAHALDPLGDTWGSSITIDNGTSVGDFPSLAEVSGRPAVSYYDAANSSLKYIRASDASGDTWPAGLTIDNTGNMGRFTSLAVVADRPAVSYKDDSAGNLRYIRASNADGSSWPVAFVVDSNANDVGSFTSLEVVSGVPAIAYVNATTGQLLYTFARNSSGNSWNDPRIIATASDSSQSVDLAVVQGRPAISFLGGTLSGPLSYVRANDTVGMQWGLPVLVDDNVEAGFGASLESANGHPAISYNLITALDGGLINYARGF